MNIKVDSLISVIMPVFNTKAEYLCEAINSILAQTYAHFELIIIDDCSKNYVQQIVKSYTDKRIKYLRLNKNSGAAIARNCGISQAKGEFIAFMDSDDISLSERFTKQIEFFNRNPEIGCLGTSSKVFGDDAKKKSFPTPKKHFEIECHLIFAGCVFCQSSVMLRKSILDNNNIKYNPQYVPAEDYALWLDLVGKTKFAVLDDILVYYRFHNENISHSQRDLQREKCTIAQYKAFERYCNISFKNKHLWFCFLNGKPISYEENKELSNNIIKIIDSLVAKGYPQKDILYIFKKRFKKLYYRTRTLKGQWYLLCSPINKLFNIKLSWRLFCFITRGLL